MLDGGKIVKTSGSGNPSIGCKGGYLTDDKIHELASRKKNELPDGITFTYWTEGDRKHLCNYRFEGADWSVRLTLDFMPTFLTQGLHEQNPPSFEWEYVNITAYRAWSAKMSAKQFDPT